MLLIFLMVVVKSSPIVFENDELIEDSIKEVGSFSINGETDQNSRTKRAVTANRSSLWDFGVIPYRIDKYSGYTSDQKAGFREAMDEWESHTCIKFVEKKEGEHENYIIFISASWRCECCSDVGKIGLIQFVPMSEICHTKGIILHELGHVIGFYHEQVRPDRDEFVKIQTQEIKSGHEHNFQQLTSEEVDSLGEPYDFESIMHYSSYGFSRGFRPTISIKLLRNGRIPQIGQRIRLSASDIRQTNKLYNCPRCGRTLHDTEGIIRSTDYHTTSGEQLRCEWYISLPYRQKIRLSFEINIPESTNCENGYLEIRDGYWHLSPLVRRVCGVGITSFVWTTGNRMLINFVSDVGVNSDFYGSYVSL